LLSSMLRDIYKGRETETIRKSFGGEHLPTQVGVAHVPVDAFESERRGGADFVKGFQDIALDSACFGASLDQTRLSLEHDALGAQPGQSKGVKQCNRARADDADRSFH